MRLTILLAAPAALAILLSAAAAREERHAAGAVRPDDPRWKLVWSDEFDAPGLPDPKKWSYEVGMVRNREAQYYTKERKENARVENGTLVIKGQAPLSELGNYQARLKSVTAGQGSYTIEFARYEPVPPTVQKTLAEQHAKTAHAEEQ